MTLLLVYLFVALGFSFFCSIAEAVLLSVTSAYVNLREKEGKRGAATLRKLKKNIDEPLAAILSLNTVAHTVGAAGVGAQSAQVFGSNALAITSAILTLLILVFSEIIPKTIGSLYWRQLAPSFAVILKYMVIILYPLVWMSRLLTRQFSTHPTLDGFSREEFAAMATLGEQEGQLAEHEARILRNLFRLRDLKTEDVLTPRSVIFALPQSTSVEHYFNKHKKNRYSRIPIFGDSIDDLQGFVLRTDLLLARARGNGQCQLTQYSRTLGSVLDKISLLRCFELMTNQGSQMLAVVNEYGDIKGIITQEDILETLLGLEIVDESDQVEDLRKLARARWLKRARDMGIEPDNLA
ncbi:CNNM domain-containing protein [Bermanella sp. R86510]|uniref:CNNM domain-containing protein n=1 Tax=unclassified Bermanella TaxID=2627862 RepID=UPI0037C84733